MAALGEFDTAWRRAGRIKGGKDGNPCAFAASELRALAPKSRSKACAPTFCCVPARNTLLTTAAPRPW